MSEPNQPSPENQPPTPPASPTSAGGGTAPAVGAAPKPPTPAAPKPAAAAAKAGPTRRFFLFSWFGTWAAVGWWTFSGSMVALTLGTVRYLFPNVLSEPPSTFKAGDVSSYEENKVDDKYKDLGSWIIRAKDERGRDIIYALSTVCTHLGCTPNWLEGEKKFKCPCHGSGFKISGVNFEGPAPRPLERFAINKTEDGQVIVNKARKFQKELGQWDDPESYILL